jgi:hypothetical protein
VQCSAVQCSAVQCSAVQCSAVQCSAVYSPEGMAGALLARGPEKFELSISSEIRSKTVYRTVFQIATFPKQTSD